MGKVTILKSPAEFELTTCKSVGNPLTQCATLLEDNFGKETIYKIIHDFIVYFDNKVIRQDMEVSHTTLKYVGFRPHGPSICLSGRLSLDNIW